MGNQNRSQYFCWASVAGFAAVCLGSAPASAADQESGFVMFDPSTTYISVYGGGTILDDDDVMRSPYNVDGNNFHSISDVGFLVGGVLGVRLNDYVRTEGELSFSRWTHSYVETWSCPMAGTPCLATPDISERLGSGGSTNAFNFFGNAWLDWDLWWDFSIYAGGGVGFTLLAYQDNHFGVDKQDISFAWQFGGGFRYRITETLLFDTRWVRRGPIRLDYGPIIFEPFEIVSDNVTLGLTYEF